MVSKPIKDEPLPGGHGITPTPRQEVIEPGATGTEVAFVLPEDKATGELVAIFSKAWGRPIKAKKRVTLDVLKQEDNVPIFVFFDSAFILAQHNAQSEIPPPFVARVVNQKTGELQMLIGNAAMRSALNNAYPVESYVGRTFAIVSRLEPHKGTMKMRRYHILEM